MATLNADFRVERGFAFGAWGLALLLTVAGCNRQRQADYSSLGLIPVTGTVRLDGQPLVGATIVFENENRTFSYGTTDAAGNYQLWFNSEQPGIAPGTKKVRITSRAADEDAAGAETNKELIPAKYNTQSEQIVEVTDGRRNFDFDLQSDR